MLASLNVSNSVQQGFNGFFGFLPNLLGFLVILVVGYVIARLVRVALSKVLHKAKVDDAVNRTPAGQWVDRISPGGRPSALIAAVAFWFIFLYVITAALGALKIPAVTAFLNQVLAYLPNVIAAVLIFIVAALIAGGIAVVVQRTMGDTPTGKFVATIAPGLVLVIAVFMILEQLKIAQQIVTITYAALIGMLALAGALAFGLGGREVAGQLWSQAYDKSSDVKDQAKSDLQTGKDRAQDQLQSAGDSQPQAPGATTRRITPPTN